MNAITSKNPAYAVLFGTYLGRCLPNGNISSRGCFAEVAPSSLPGFVVKTLKRADRDAFLLWVWLVLRRECRGPFDPYIQAVYINPHTQAVQVVMRELSPQTDSGRSVIGAADYTAYDTLDKLGATSLYADCAYLERMFDVYLYWDLHKDNWMLDGSRYVANDPIIYNDDPVQWDAVVRCFLELAVDMPNRIMIEEAAPEQVNEPWALVEDVRGAAAIGMLQGGVL